MSGEPPDPACGPADSGRLPDGLRIYAVGDVHGRFDLLEALYAEIRRDLADRRPERSIEIFLGDYIDRGPQSRDVVEWLLSSQPECDERLCLMGNHEDLLLGALDDPSAVDAWLLNGGVETILSYCGANAAALAGATFAEARDAFVAAFPESHRAFVAGLPRMKVFGGYVFVHAGLNPERPLDRQDPFDLLWIREPFLSSRVDFGRVVVHGHTPAAEPEIRPTRINIDTGAFFTGRLTCLVLEGGDRRFLHAVEQ